MTDPLLAQRLDRIEATQVDLSARIGRIEAAQATMRNDLPPAAAQPGAVPPREDGSGRWMTIGLWVLVALAAIWLIDELPGPSLIDRLF